jgi:DNA-binding transcriptional MerR regulator
MRRSPSTTTYTMKEVSRKLKLPTGTLRKWEQDFQAILEVPRSRTGARYYTEQEIEILLQIKQMRNKHLSAATICSLLSCNTEENENNEPSHPLPTDNETPTIQQIIQNDDGKTLDDLKKLMESFDALKDEMIKEVREEIRHEVRQEVLQEVKKEIAASTQTQTMVINESVSHTTKEIQNLSKSVENQQKMSQQQIEEEREVNRQNIIRREEQFIEFVKNHREVAAAKQERENRKLKRLIPFWR